ncbi:hypothetical protein ACVWYG_001032 [Pedobacter sp. UYEF25]
MVIFSQFPQNDHCIWIKSLSLMFTIFKSEWDYFLCIEL